MVLHQGDNFLYGDVYSASINGMDTFYSSVKKSPEVCKGKKIKIYLANYQ